MHDDSIALVSVIVPICNVETFLSQALESIRNQTYKNLEIICINDGSEDASLDIIQQFAADDARFMVIDKQNEGYGATCNLGIDMAHGKWVSIIEPDDWIDQNMYEEMLQFAANFDEEIDIIKTPWYYVLEWDNPRTTRIENAEIHSRVPTSKKPFSVASYPLLIESHPSIWSALYRRDFLNEKGIRFIPYPGAGWADNPFLIESFCQASNIIYLNKPYYYYRSDLPGATQNHATKEAISRPFDRWLDMKEIIDRLGITDTTIINSHYLRGFNYLSGAIHDDGWSNPIVQEKANEMFTHMNKDLVLANPKIRIPLKRLYLELTDQEGKVGFTASRAKNVIDESIHLFRRSGVKGIIRRVKRRYTDRLVSKE